MNELLMHRILISKKIPPVCYKAYSMAWNSAYFLVRMCAVAAATACPSRKLLHIGRKDR